MAGDNPNEGGGANRKFACVTGCSRAKSCISTEENSQPPARNPVPALALVC
jgi:hypothetical protein